MVTEQINPKLEKLNNERSQYIEFQKTSRELDHALRLYLAWQFLQTDVSIFIF
jgi:structural maintenance of chromosome 2